MAIYKSSKITKDGRKYFFRVKYKDIFGIQHDYTSPKFKTRKEAIDSEASYRIKVAERNIPISHITFNDIFKEYIEDKKSKVKKQTIKKDYILFKHLSSIGNVKINDFDLTKYRKLHNYIITLPFKAMHKNKILGLLKRLILYSKKYYNTSDHIVSFIETYKDTNEIKEEMQFFTIDEYNKYDRIIDDFEYHTFFELLYFLGLRQGECQALTWNDVDFKNKTIRINKTLTTKIKGENWTITPPKTKNSIRVLPLPIKLLNDLKNMHDVAKKYNDYNNNWFVFGNTEPFKESTINNRKNKYCKLADVKQIRIHDFRHSCASLLFHLGLNIVAISKYLGHANTSITLNVYAHMYESELETITNKLNTI